MYKKTGQLLYKYHTAPSFKYNNPETQKSILTGKNQYTERE